MVQVRNKLGIWNMYSGMCILYATDKLANAVGKKWEDYKSTYWKSAKPDGQIADCAITMRPHSIIQAPKNQTWNGNGILD